MTDVKSLLESGWHMSYTFWIDENAAAVAHRRPGSLSDLGDRSEQGGRRRTNTHDFEAHSGGDATTKSPGAILHASPTGVSPRDGTNTKSPGAILHASPAGVSPRDGTNTKSPGAILHASPTGVSPRDGTNRKQGYLDPFPSGAVDWPQVRQAPRGPLDPVQTGPVHEEGCPRKDGHPPWLDNNNSSTYIVTIQYGQRSPRPRAVGCLPRRHLGQGCPQPPARRQLCHPPRPTSHGRHDMRACPVATVQKTSDQTAVAACPALHPIGVSPGRERRGVDPGAVRDPSNTP